LQVLFSNGVGFGWNIYLSYMSYKVDETAEVGTEIVNTIGSQAVEK
jgi:Mpv17 / PMP22 family